MKEDDKIRARKAGVTERGIMLVDECEKFMNENKNFVNRGVKSDEELKKMEELLEKIEWYGREIEIERKKSLEQIEKYSMGSNKDAAM